MSPYKDPEKKKAYLERNKEAQRQRNRRYYKDNQGHLVEYARRYRKTDGYKARVTEYKRQYAIDNRERINQRAHEWYLKNKEKARAYRKAWALKNPDRRKQYRINSTKKLKKEVFEAYGGAICACCKESNQLFLTIDHINGNGNEHRRSLGSRGGKTFYSWLRRNNFPDGYQVLCFNCNMAKGHYGFCPHTITPL